MVSLASHWTAKSVKLKLNVLLTVALLILVTGCATGPGYKEYTDKLAVKPIAKGFIIIDRPAGEYEIATSTESKRSLKLSLDKGDEKYVRLEMKMGFFVGHVNPVLVEPEVGMKEIVKTKYVGESTDQ